MRKRLLEHFKKKEIISTSVTVPTSIIEQGGLKNYIGTFTISSEEFSCSNISAGSDVRRSLSNLGTGKGTINIDSMDINALRRILGLQPVQVSDDL